MGKEGRENTVLIESTPQYHFLGALRVLVTRPAPLYTSSQSASPLMFANKFSSPDQPAGRDKGHPDSSPPSTPLSPVVSRKVTEHCSNFKEENMDTSR